MWAWSVTTYRLLARLPSGGTDCAEITNDETSGRCIEKSAYSRRHADMRTMQTQTDRQTLTQTHTHRHTDTHTHTFSVRVGVLQSLKQPQRLINGPSNGQVVHRDLAHNLLRINQKQATQRNPSLGNQHAVICRDLLRQVRHQRNVHRTQTALLRGTTGERHPRSFHNIAPCAASASMPNGKSASRPKWPTPRRPAPQTRQPGRRMQ
jgi:hypothetical protein